MDPGERHIAVIGTFDGVHLGHRYLLDKLIERGRERGLSPMVVTFRQHPLSVIRPDAVPPMLTAPHEKEALLRRAGVDSVVTLDFDEKMRQMTAGEFMAMLRDRYGVDEILMGFNHRFGSDRNLTFDDFCRAGREVGVGVSLSDEYRPDGGPAVSSSAIRAMLGRGEVEKAAAALGRHYAISGTVGHGKQIGRSIGFPTANIEPFTPAIVIPAIGVYAAEVTLPGGDVRKAVVNIGRRPTVDGSAAPPLTIEAHIPGFDGDLYGREVKVEFSRRIRDERRFPSLDALRRQIALDIASL